VLPQTNLQLYWVLHQRGASADTLATVGAAYDAARQLFAASFRANRKQFLCHLVGTAGALASWGEGAETIAAGMLHSAYLYGDFGDGKRGAVPSRCRWLRSLVGEEAESLVVAYTSADWNRPLSEIIDAARTDRTARDIAAIKLADVLDEVSDAGPAYCPNRKVDLIARSGAGGEQSMMALAQEIVGPTAVQDFRQAFAMLAEWTPPACVQSTDRAFHVISPGVDELRRGVVGRGLEWAGRRLALRKAA
jgi:hypothetical protein